jgi:hypothetical protein
VPQSHQTYSLLAGAGALASVPPGTSILAVTGYSGDSVAEFDDSGNLILQGGLSTQTEPMPPAGSFVVRAPDQTVAGYIDLIGNMHIRGDLNELANCSIAGGGFLVRDWFGNTVACIDAAGNLCLAGRLHRNR